MAKTVIGLIDTIDDAQAAVRDLVESGIAQEDIGFMADQRHEVPATAQLNESEGALAGARVRGLFRPGGGGGAGVPHRPRAQGGDGSAG